MLKPETIETYELIDFSQFFKWIMTHIKDQKTIQITEYVQLKFNDLQLEFARRIDSWNDNPDEISVPISLSNFQE
ncbi:hypothetical protein LCGC14_1876240 [marine sediment metagenome]|uniref:Uncharacterized protein n=1 Tax=marine sediment metagenome TaxID=412755 RepID=A0A0F9J294_9ZZZZ